MLNTAFGFDLLGQSDKRLRAGLAWGVATAAVEVLTYAALYHVLVPAIAGDVDSHVVLQAAALFGVTALVLVWLRAKAYTENFSVSYAAVAAARLRIADYIAKLPAGAFTQKRAEIVAELLTGRFQLYQDVVVHVWGLAVANAALPVLLWLLLVFVDWRLAIVAAMLVPVAFLAIPWSHRLLSRASARLAQVRNPAIGAVVDQIDGLREFRQFDLRGARLEHAECELEALEKEQMRLELAPAPALFTFGFILQLGLGLTAMVAASFVESAWIGATTLIVFIVIAQRFFRAIGDLSVNMAELRFARDVLGEIRALASEPALPEGTCSTRPVDSSVRFENVGFSYGNEAVIRSISGRVAPGTMLALVGMSGSGKSTLAGLVARLQDVTEGSIFIGGVDVRDLPTDTLNAHVAMVLQDVVLFEGTVADNIRLGRPDASDADVAAAARAAEAHEFISRLPEGYETRIAANGANMSGGERQRLAIARALLKDAPILILDEATSSVDLANEERLQRAIARLASGRTLVVIAHRLWTVTGADQIWVLEDGEVIQRGSHRDLLAREGRYRRLWNAQIQARSWRIGQRRGAD